jgi:epoxyqueuosine reductase QueG
MIEQIIENRLGSSADHIYGFANLKGLLYPEFKDYPYGISIGRRLDDAIVDSIENGPTAEYYDHYNDTNDALNKLSTGICEDLRKNRVKCVPVIATITSTEDEYELLSETLRYKVSHKMIATRAGLGWIGKTDLLVTREFGARLRLVSILIDTPVKVTGKAVERSKCGHCDICVKRCPAKAANGRLWDIHTDRDLFFDAYKCRNMCRELGRTLLQRDTRICGICVSVCPVGRIENPNLE